MEEYRYSEVTAEDEAILAAEEMADQEETMGLDDDLGAEAVSDVEAEPVEEAAETAADGEVEPAEAPAASAEAETETAEADHTETVAAVAAQDARDFATESDTAETDTENTMAEAVVEVTSEEPAVESDAETAPEAPAAETASETEPVAEAADTETTDTEAVGETAPATEETDTETADETVAATEETAENERQGAAADNGGNGNKKRPQLVTVVGVRFRTAGKAYYFSPGPYRVYHGMHVIVETARGIEYGTVVTMPMELDKRKIKSPLKEIIRIATPEDDTTHKENRRQEREAYKVCYHKIRERGLDMKLIDAEYTFDHSKILFYFTADGRIDFRDLVKDLAGKFKTRIELRQIGVRDETKILGGYGSCGRPLCCHTYLSDFVPVSIKMAKEQNLSLNPTKISGVCGRLMCCLKNEQETYEELNKNLPRQGDEVEGPDGLQGEVESVNVLRQKVRILVEIDDEKELHEYNADEITMIRRRKRGEAKHRSKRIENGQESADELKKTTRKGNRPDRLARMDDAERGNRGGDGERQGRGENDRPARDGNRNNEERPARENNRDNNERQNRGNGERRGRENNRDNERGERGERGAQGENNGQERKERRRPEGRRPGRGSREDRQNAAREHSNREDRQNAPRERGNRENGNAESNHSGEGNGQERQNGGRNRHRRGGRGRGERQGGQNQNGGQGNAGSQNASE